MSEQFYSDSASDVEGLNQEVDVELGNVTQAEPAVHLEQELSDMQPREPVLLLFDLNGVLIQRSDFEKGANRHVEVRPGIQQLLKLSPRYKLGVYTSTTKRTASHAVDIIVSAINKRSGDGLAGAPVDRSLFEVVLDRQHCQPDPQWRARGGNKWDTVKPLQIHGFDLARVILIDDDAKKGLELEAGNMLVSPAWDNSADKGEAAWSVLVDGLLAIPEDAQDVRQYTASLAKRLQDAHIPAAAAALDGNTGGSIASRVRQLHQSQAATASNAASLSASQPPPDQDTADKQLSTKGQRALARASRAMAALLDPAIKARKAASQLPYQPKSSWTSTAIAAAFERGGYPTGWDRPESGAGAERLRVLREVLLPLLLQDSTLTAKQKAKSMRDLGMHRLGSHPQMDQHFIVLLTAMLALYHVLVQGTVVQSTLAPAALAAYNSLIPKGHKKLGTPFRLPELKAYLDDASLQDKVAQVGPLFPGLPDRCRLISPSPSVSEVQQLIHKGPLPPNAQLSTLHPQVAAALQLALQQLQDGPPIADALEIKLFCQLLPVPLARHFGVVNGNPENIVQALKFLEQQHLVVRPKEPYHKLPSWTLVAFPSADQVADALAALTTVECVPCDEHGMPRDQQQVQQLQQQLELTGQAALYAQYRAQLLGQLAALPATCAPQLAAHAQHPEDQMQQQILQPVEVVADQAADVGQSRLAEKQPMQPAVNLQPPDHMPRWATEQASRGSTAAQPATGALGHAACQHLVGTSADNTACTSAALQLQSRVASDTRLGTANQESVSALDTAPVQAPTKRLRPAGAQDVSQGVANMEHGNAASHPQAQLDMLATDTPAPGGTVQMKAADAIAASLAAVAAAQLQTENHQLAGNGSISATDAASDMDIATLQPEHTVTVVDTGTANKDASDADGDISWWALCRDPSLKDTSCQQDVQPAVQISGGIHLKGQHAGQKRQRGLDGACPLYDGPTGSSRHKTLHPLTGQGADTSVYNVSAQQGCGPSIRTFSKLHDEVQSFASRSAPSPEEIHLLGAALQSIEVVVRSIWPQGRPVLFGSQASGLALPGSDLDIVIAGVMDGRIRPAEGFDQSDQEKAMQMLGALAYQMQCAGLVDDFELIRAKVPIVKAHLQVLDDSGEPMGKPLQVDLSIGTTNGAAAVRLMRCCIEAVPPLRPLCLVLKAMLKEAGLNEVFTGGVSSYSLFNMVLAHLQCEGYDCSQLLAGSQQEMDADVPWNDWVLPYLGTLQDMRCVDVDLGKLLKGFLRRFSEVFDYATEAVSICNGGVTDKALGWRQTHTRRGKSHPSLAVEDPQQSGRDIASGSYNIGAVVYLFALGLQQMEDLQEAERASHQDDDDAAAWAAIQADGMHHSLEAPVSSSILSAIVDVEMALGREEFVMEERQRHARELSAKMQQERPVNAYKKRRRGADQGGPPSGSTGKLSLAPLPGAVSRGKKKAAGGKQARKRPIGVKGMPGQPMARKTKAANKQLKDLRDLMFNEWPEGNGRKPKKAKKQKQQAAQHQGALPHLAAAPAPAARRQGNSPASRRAARRSSNTGVQRDIRQYMQPAPLPKPQKKAAGAKKGPKAKSKQQQNAGRAQTAKGGKRDRSQGGGRGGWVMY